MLDIGANEGAIEIRAEKRNDERAGAWAGIIARVYFRMCWLDLSGIVDEADRLAVW